MEKYTEERPWGSFEQFSKNEKTTVKVLQINPNEGLSLQYHHKRDEFWKVMDGTGSIVIGNDTKTGKKGDEFFIPRKTNHQIKTADSFNTVLGISFGDFDEGDIVRLKDKYNRN